MGWGGGVGCGGGGEKLGIKLKLSFSWGLGLAELGNNLKNMMTTSKMIMLTSQKLEQSMDPSDSQILLLLFQSKEKEMFKYFEHNVQLYNIITFQDPCE